MNTETKAIYTVVAADHLGHIALRGIYDTHRKAYSAMLCMQEAKPGLTHFVQSIEEVDMEELEERKLAARWLREQRASPAVHLHAHGCSTLQDGIEAHCDCR